MDTLPQELVNQIAYYLEASKHNSRGVPQTLKLSPYATLSRSWKEAVEVLTYATLTIRSNEIEQLRATVTNHRRQCVKEIRYEILLPEYSDEACGRQESDEDKRLNDEAFTKAFRDLFLVLKHWEDEGVTTSIRLELPEFYSPTDIFAMRYESSFLRLLKDTVLPKLANVRSLELHSSLRFLAPIVGPLLAASLPRLENIDWQLPECEEPVHNRRDNRAAWAEALKFLLPKRSTVRIDVGHDCPFDQRIESGPRLIPSGLSYDPFSSSLRTFSYNLASLDLRGNLDSTIFWPAAEEEDCVTPAWPNLKTLIITFDMLSPSGQWYFTGQRPADHEDNNPDDGTIGGDTDGTDYTNYREHGDPATLNPFLAAFAKAVQRMPILEHFKLDCRLAPDKGHFTIFYYAPSIAAEYEYGDEGEDDLLSRRVYYEVYPIWRPDEDIMQGIRCAGEEKFGGEVIESFLRSQWVEAGDYLPTLSRRVFNNTAIPILRLD